MSRSFGFSIAPGTLAALAGAGSSNTDQNVEKCLLTGDLSQMGTMARALQNAGFDVRNSDVYPVLQGDEIVPGLRYLYDHRIPGWRNQMNKFTKYGICTEQEYRDKLALECGR